MKKILIFVLLMIAIFVFGGCRQKTYKLTGDYEYFKLENVKPNNVLLEGELFSFSLDVEKIPKDKKVEEVFFNKKKITDPFSKNTYKANRNFELKVKFRDLYKYEFAFEKGDDFLKLIPEKTQYFENEVVVVEIVPEKLELGKIITNIYINGKEREIKNNQIILTLSDELALEATGVRKIKPTFLKADAEILDFDIDGIDKSLVNYQNKYTKGTKLLINKNAFSRLSENSQRVKAIKLNGRELDLEKDNWIVLETNSRLLVEVEKIPIFKIIKSGSFSGAIVLNPELSVYLENTKVTVSIDKSKIAPHFKFLKLLVDGKECKHPYSFEVVKETTIEIVTLEDTKHKITLQDEYGILKLKGVLNSYVYDNEKLTIDIDREKIPHGKRNPKVFIDDEEVSLPFSLKVKKSIKISLKLTDVEKVKLIVENDEFNLVKTNPLSREVFLGDSIKISLDLTRLPDTHRLIEILLDGEGISLNEEKEIILTKTKVLKLKLELIPVYEITKLPDIEIYVDGKKITDTTFFKEGTKVLLKSNKVVSEEQILIIEIDGVPYNNEEFRLTKNITVSSKVIDNPELITQATIIVPEGVVVNGLKTKYLIGIDKVLLKAPSLYRFTKVLINDEEIIVNSEEKEIVITKNIKIEVKDLFLDRYKQKINLLLGSGVTLSPQSENNEFLIGSKIKIEISELYILTKVFLNNENKLTDPNQKTFTFTVNETLNSLTIETKQTKARVLLEVCSGVLVSDSFTGGLIEIGKIINLKVVEQHKGMRKIIVIKNNENTETEYTNNFDIEVTSDLVKIVVREIVQIEFEINPLPTFIIQNKTENNYYRINTELTILPIKYYKFKMFKANGVPCEINPDGSVKVKVGEENLFFAELLKDYVKVTFASPFVNFEGEVIDGNYFKVGSNLTFKTNKEYALHKVIIDGVVYVVHKKEYSFTVGNADTNINFVLYRMLIKPIINVPSGVEVSYSKAPDSEGFYDRGVGIIVKLTNNKYLKHALVDNKHFNFELVDHINELRFYLGFEVNEEIVITESDFYNSIKIVKKFDEALKLNDPKFMGKVYTSFRVSVSDKEYIEVLENVEYETTGETVVWFKKPGTYFVEAINGSESVIYEIEVEFNVIDIKLEYELKKDELKNDFFDYEKIVREVGYNNLYRPNIFAYVKALNFDSELKKLYTSASNEAISDNLSFNYDFFVGELIKNEYIDIVDSRAIKFKESAKELENQKVELKITYNGHSVKETFILVNGHNAYTDRELRLLFRNQKEVEKILLHRDIKLQIEDYQKDIWTDRDGNVRVSLINGGSNYEGSFFVRRISDQVNDKFIDFNGNCHFINAENIPLVKPADYANEDGKYFSSVISDVTSAVFKFEIDGLNNTNRRNKIRNVKLKGNTNVPGHTGQVEPGVAYGSAGLLAFQTLTSSVEIDNFNAQYFVMAVYHRGGVCKLSHIKSDNQWGTGVLYSNRYEKDQNPGEAFFLEIFESEFKKSGGPAIAIFDYDKRVRSGIANEDELWEEACSPTDILEWATTEYINIDGKIKKGKYMGAKPNDLKGLTFEQFNRDPYVHLRKIKIDNYIDGNSQWFTANGFAAASILGQVEDALNLTFTEAQKILPNMVPHIKTLYKNIDGVNHFNAQIYCGNNNVLDAKEERFDLPYSGCHNHPQIDLFWDYMDQKRKTSKTHSYKSWNYKYQRVINDICKLGSGFFAPIGTDFAGDVQQSYDASISQGKEKQAALIEAFGRSIVMNTSKFDRITIRDPEGRIPVEFHPYEIPKLDITQGLKDYNFPGFAIIEIRNK